MISQWFRRELWNSDIGMSTTAFGNAENFGHPTNGTENPISTLGSLYWLAQSNSKWKASVHTTGSVAGFGIGGLANPGSRVCPRRSLITGATDEASGETAEAQRAATAVRGRGAVAEEQREAVGTAIVGLASVAGERRDSSRSA